MKYSQIKQVKEFCNGLFSEPNWREVVEQLDNCESDFDVNNVRFIKDSEILSIMAEELVSDIYVLGCFSAWFISEQTGWPTVLVEAAQKGEAYSELGEAIADTVDMEAFAECYASADGYGHHFNHWDGNSEEITINGELYHVFDTH